MHQHDHSGDVHHNDDHHHDHDHGHGHTHVDGGVHHHAAGDHEHLLKTKEETVAFLQYTLHHNAHHEEELSGLAHSLDHLALSKEASEIRQCIDDITRSNKRLEAVLAALK